MYTACDCTLPHSCRQVRASIPKDSDGPLPAPLRAIAAVHHHPQMSIAVESYLPCSAVSSRRHFLHGELLQAVYRTPGEPISAAAEYFIQNIFPTSCSVVYDFIFSSLMMQVPLHLREDFSGTGLISATWCKGDIRRTALAVDIDRETLHWGWCHNGQIMLGWPESQLCFVEANVSLQTVGAHQCHVNNSMHVFPL